VLAGYDPIDRISGSMILVEVSCEWFSGLNIA